MVCPTDEEDQYETDKSESEGNGEVGEHSAQPLARGYQPRRGGHGQGSGSLLATDGRAGVPDHPGGGYPGHVHRRPQQLPRTPLELRHGGLRQRRPVRRGARVAPDPPRADGQVHRGHGRRGPKAVRQADSHTGQDAGRDQQTLPEAPRQQALGPDTLPHPERGRVRGLRDLRGVRELHHRGLHGRPCDRQGVGRGTHSCVPGGRVDDHGDPGTRRPEVQAEDRPGPDPGPAVLWRAQLARRRDLPQS